MAKFENQTFLNQSLVIDGNEYDRCKFIGCNIVFTGVQDVSLTHNSFDHCRWSLDGPAARTIQYMAALYAGGARELVEATFKNIREKGKPAPEISGG